VQNDICSGSSKVKINQEESVPAESSEDSQHSRDRKRARSLGSVQIESNVPDEEDDPGGERIKTPSQASFEHQ